MIGFGVAEDAEVIEAVREAIGADADRRGDRLGMIVGPQAK